MDPEDPLHDLLAQIPELRAEGEWSPPLPVPVATD